MEPITLQYERWGKSLIVRTENMPGYKCLGKDGCGVEVHEGKATIEFLFMAVSILRENRDHSNLGFLKEELQSARRRLAVYNRDEKGRFAKGTSPEGRDWFYNYCCSKLN